MSLEVWGSEYNSFTQLIDSDLWKYQLVSRIETNLYFLLFISEPVHSYSLPPLQPVVEVIDHFSDHQVTGRLSRLHLRRSLAQLALQGQLRALRALDLILLIVVNFYDQISFCANIVTLRLHFTPQFSHSFLVRQRLKHSLDFIYLRLKHHKFPQIVLVTQPSGPA